MLWRPGEWRSCTTPRLVRDVGPVACGVCVNCGKARVKDWIGRSLAEAETADRRLFATLTIGGDRLYEAGIAANVRAQQFHPDDVRAYLKRLRWFIFDDWRNAQKQEEAKREYLHLHEMKVLPAKPPRLRYFLVGENGDRKNRVHYHLLLYFYGCKGPTDLSIGRFLFHGKYPPGVVVNGNIVDPEKPRWDFRSRGSGIDWVKSERTYWPFGMVRYQEFTPEHPYYVASYCTKALGEAEVMRPGISKAPLLGAKYFERLAMEHADQMISPQRKTYCVTRNEGYRGHNPEYWMSEAACRYLSRIFLRLWEEAWKADPTRPQHYPYSDLVDECVAWDDDRAAEKAARKSSRLRVREQVEAEFWALEERQKRRHWERLPRDMSDAAYVPSSGSSPSFNRYRRLKEGDGEMPLKGLDPVRRRRVRVD